MIKLCLEKLRHKENLTESEISGAMRALMTAEATPEQTKEFLLTMREKHATIEEITGAAKILRDFWIPVKTRHQLILDTCGTGGDKCNTFNISTVVALVVASAGVAVAKHGNRSVSSKCGSADILEAFGVRLLTDPDKLGECLDELGIAFLFAQALHPAMKNVSAVRKELGVETVFNILGPLINPARNTHQMMGIYSRDLVRPIAEVLRNLGLEKAFVVHGSDGLDEITITGKTFVAEWNGEGIESYEIDPQEFGIPPAKLADLQGGDLIENLQIFKGILDGQTGPKRDIVVLNAAYALYLAGRVKNIKEGIAFAGHLLDDGQARKKLEALKAFTNR